MNELANYSDELIRIGKPNENHLDITADGLDILDGNTSLADFTATSSRIGKEGEKHVQITNDGMDILDDETSLANFTASGARIGADNSPNIQLADGKIKIYKQSSSDIEPVAVFGRGVYEALNPPTDGLRLHGLIGASSAIVGYSEFAGVSPIELIMPMEGAYGIRISRGGIDYAEDGTATYTQTTQAFTILDQDENGLHFDTRTGTSGGGVSRWTLGASGDTTLPRPLGISSGGTGATTAESARAALGIQSGSVDITTTSSYYIDQAITFANAYAAAPVIQLTIKYALSGSSATNAEAMAGLSAIVQASSASGFTIRLWNFKLASGNTITVYWTAIGNPA